MKNESIDVLPPEAPNMSAEASVEVAEAEAKTIAPQPFNTKTKEAEKTLGAAKDADIASQDVRPPQDTHPLAIATDLGRYASAYRELIELQKIGGDPNEFLDKDAIERVTRIGAKFTDAMKMFETQPEDLKINEENKKLKLRWGMKLEEATLILVSVCDIDVNVMKVLSLDLEADLENKISDADLKQEMFSEPHAHDVSWHKHSVKSGLGTKFDDILMTSSVDALDEPLKAVCSLKYTLDAGATADPYGTPIPKVDPGHTRSPYYFNATAWTPLALGGDKMRGIRKFETTTWELDSIIVKILSMMPNFVLKKLIRQSVESKIKLISEVLQNAEDLKEIDGRMQMLPRSKFIEQVRSHIDACSF